MKKIINDRIFTKYEDFWLSNIDFDNNETTIEIFKDELNESLIIDILDKIKDNSLLDLKKYSIRLLESLSMVFWGHNDNMFFSFSGFIIDTQIDFQQSDFRMCFHCSGLNNFSDYANWLVEIKDFKIVGCKRQQL